MINILVRGIVFAFLTILSSIQCSASIQLVSEWQELNASAEAGNEESSDPQYVQESYDVVAGFPVQNFVHAGATVNNGSADAIGSQSGVYTNSVFACSGSLNLDTSGSPAFTFSSGFLYQYFDINVIDQPEFITICVSSFNSSWSTGVLYGDQPSITWSLGPRNSIGGGPPIGGSNINDLYTNSPLVPVGQYVLVITCDGALNEAGEASSSVNYTTQVIFSNLVVLPGAFQTNPIVSSQPGGATVTYGSSGDYTSFDDVTAESWIDPLTANAFSFQMKSNSLFNAISAFPVGFSDSFEVRVGTNSLGSFTTNDSVNFIQALGAGVSSFEVRNIKPAVDPTLQTAFPIQLGFNTDTASFLMIPDPGIVPPQQGNSNLIYFGGILQQSTDLVNWSDVAGSPPSPYTIPGTNAPAQLFFRARSD